MSKQNTVAVILAAGKGTRMHSDKPKALQTLLGETMLHYVASTAATVAQSVITVIGHGHELVRKGIIPADRIDVGAGILKRTLELPSPDEMDRVSERLRVGGWPVTAD